MKGEGRVKFRHVQVRLIFSKEPLLGCGHLPDWLRKKQCNYAVDNENDNLCIWRCLVIANWITSNQARLAKRATKDSLNLAHEFYSNPKLRVTEVKPTELVDFENIASRFQVNIKLYEPVHQSAWRLVFREAPDSSIANNVDIGLYEGHCFYIKDLNIPASH